MSNISQIQPSCCRAGSGGGALFSGISGNGKVTCASFPFSPQALKGGFARLQSCFAELGALPKEGVFQPKEEAVVQAVLDGLQQFKQYTGQGMAGASLSSSSVEVRSGHGRKGRGPAHLKSPKQKQGRIAQASSTEFCHRQDPPWGCHEQTLLLFFGNSDLLGNSGIRLWALATSIYFG